MCPLVSGLCHCIMSSSFIHVVACVNSIFFSRLSNISYVHILHFACFFIFTFLFYWLLYWRMVVFRKVLSQMLRSERERNSKTLELAEEKRASSYPQTLLNRLPRWRCAQSCPTLCDPMGCNPPGSSVHGDSPGKNPGVGCHALLQGIFPTQGLNPGLPQCRQILYHLSHQEYWSG